MKWLRLILPLLIVAAFIAATLTHPHFWRTANQKGDALLHAGKFQDAARAYEDPARSGIALYRGGEFEAAAKMFARVPGADGAYNQGNALLMHGQYSAAISAYDRALVFHPGWQDAQDNKSVAAARKARLDAAGQHRDEEQADAYEPDKIVFDQKGENKNAKPVELSAPSLSDEALRASWLRRVSTTPGDFLRARFAWQAANPDAAKKPAP